MRYEIDGTPTIISFGLGVEVTVNSNIGLPTLRQWGGVLNFTESILSAPKLDRQFPLHYEPTKQGLPLSVQFDAELFFRPSKTCSHSNCVQFSNVLFSNVPDGPSKGPKDTPITPSSSGPTVKDSSTGDCFRREVLLPPSNDRNAPLECLESLWMTVLTYMPSRFLQIYCTLR